MRSFYMTLAEYYGTLEYLTISYKLQLKQEEVSFALLRHLEIHKTAINGKSFN
ncbi:hypothetical protein DFQ05_1622 [Winogradskyella wandonensis]|uniref:Uncharacterized protein n=1 Tax=Winogradskyella wandonensis TaxID=1442586 RepID=A0A4R1KTH3_9FLAO|nr:hypothetical protein DFQ05_1622 [Winogradskyella wandonensis]